LLVDLLSPSVILVLCSGWYKGRYSKYYNRTYRLPEFSISRRWQ